MNKKQKRIVIIVLVITGIIISLAISGIKLPFVSAPVGCESSVLNIDQVSISRTATDLGETVFQLILSGNQKGQCVYGYLDNAQLEQKIESAIGKDIKIQYSNPFQITLKRLETSAYYSISPTAIPIYRYTYTPSSIHKFSGILGIGTSFLICKTGVPYITDSCSKRCTDVGYMHSNCEFRADKDTDCYCWDFPVYGNAYNFNKDKLYEKLNVIISTGDGVTQPPITLDTESNRDSYSTSIRDGLYASFEGFLQGTKLIPDTKDYKVFDKAGIKKVSTNPLTYSTQTPLCENQISFPQIESCAITYNKNLDKGISTPLEFSSASVLSDSIKLPISGDTFYPIIKIQVKAKWLGIYEPVAEPDIFNCQNVKTEFRNKKSADSSYSLKIKSGTGSQGTFNIYAACNSGFDASPDVNSRTIVGTETQQGIIKITQKANSNADSTCTFKASITRLGYTKEDTCTITADGSQSCAIESESCASIPCCENLKCESGVCKKQVGVEICFDKVDNDGDGLVDCLDSDCKDSIYCGENETGVCKTCDDYAINYIFGSFWKSKSCTPQKGSLVVGIFGSIINGIFGTDLNGYPQTPTICVFSFIKIGLMVIVLIFGTLFGIDLLERFRSLQGRKKKIWRFVIALVVSGIIAYLIFIAFWIGILLLLGFVVLKFFFGNVFGASYIKYRKLRYR